MGTREILWRVCVSERVMAAKLPVSPQVPFSSTSEDLEQERREQ